MSAVTVSDAAGSRMRSRLRIADIFTVGGAGLRTRKMRAILSALGISIGIAAMVAVLGLSESSRADLNAEIEKLGTNLLTIEPSGGFGGGDGVLPVDAAAMVARIGPVEEAAAVINVNGAIVRNDVMNPNQTAGITAVGAGVTLLETLNGTVADGVYLNDATAAYPNVVLGSVAAERLAVDDVADNIQVSIGGVWFSVIGILDPFPLAPDLDRAALIGEAAAVDILGSEPNAEAIYVRADPRAIDAVRDILPATADPENPDEVGVSRPSDVLSAQAAADDAFTSLFLGLGAVALLVGGIGVANVMVIAVIERRNEIGLRRALGATSAHIRRQFLTEALILSILGGAAGVAIGALVTFGYARTQDWMVVIPMEAALGGFLAAVLIGAVAGIYPAMRAARLAPTEALRA